MLRRILAWLLSRREPDPLHDDETAKRIANLGREYAVYRRGKK